MIKVVELIPSLKDIGGAEKFFLSLSESLSKHCEVICITLYNDANEYTKEFFRGKNIELIALNKRKGPDLKCGKKLIKLLKVLSPDIVHTHLSCLPTYFLGNRLKKHKWKLVHTIHSLPKHDTNFFSDLIKKMYARLGVLYFVGISDLVSREFRVLYPQINIRTIYNGIFLEDVSEEKKHFDLICVARFEKVKNHTFLLDSLKILQSKKPNVSLVCVGGGSLLEEIKNYCKNQNIKNVTFTGFTNNVYEYLAKSKVFILTSLYEGNPISILEAKNAGLPVIAPRVGGIPDVVTHNTDGLLYEPGNINELINYECLMLEKKTFYKILSNKSKQSSTKYSIESTGKEYYNYFMNILGM